MFITDLFKFTHTCRHEHVTPDRECAYCPDCGKLIKNEWYITRCACCGVKLKAMFIVEKLDQINFIDINFAALLKRIVEAEANICTTTRCWQEKTPVQPKLLVQYL